MSLRRTAREYALQLLFQWEHAREDFDRARGLFWERAEAVEGDCRAFTEGLVSGVVTHAEAIDALIVGTAANWKLNRMPAVDRNILRLAVYELKECPEIPVKVTINEAIEIAKKFGTEESGAFVNGVLDKIAKELGKT